MKKYSEFEFEEEEMDSIAVERQKREQEVLFYEACLQFEKEAY